MKSRNNLRMLGSLEPPNLSGKYFGFKGFLALPCETATSAETTTTLPDEILGQGPVRLEGVNMAVTPGASAHELRRFELPKNFRRNRVEPSDLISRSRLLNPA